MRPTVYISSFRKSKRLPEGVEKWSAAVYQPKGFDFPKAEWCDIRVDGTWQRPRDFLEAESPLHAYRAALLRTYRSRSEEAALWLSELAGPAALLCWCPYDRAAQRQMEQFGSFVCHTAVLAEVLRDDHKCNVFLDGDRLMMAVLTQESVDA